MTTLNVILPPEEFNITRYEDDYYINDSSHNHRLPPDAIMSYPTAQAVFYIGYVTIFLLGVYGNCLVCYVVFRNRHMQTVTNFFIANLALADILLCVLAVPFTPLYFFMREWIFGSVLCHLLSMAQGVSVYVSTLTLTSIAIDRFFVILYPFRPRLRLQACYCIIICIWIFSITSTLPYAFYMDQIEYKKIYYCEEFWPSETIRRIFSVFTAIMQFVVPFIIILFCYVKISVRMSQRVKSKPGSKTRRKEELDRERKKRTNRMLIGMVTIFGISWLPMNVIHLVGDYFVRASHWPYYNLCFFISHVVAMSSTCYNPFLYAWLNENFRKEFQMVLPCFAQTDLITSKESWRRDNTCNGIRETDNQKMNISTVTGSRVRASSPQATQIGAMDEEEVINISPTISHKVSSHIGAFGEISDLGQDFEMEIICNDNGSNRGPV